MAAKPLDSREGGRSFADRLLRVLDVFDAETRRMPLTEISRRSGLPLPTAHRIVAKLTAWGALERGDDGMYHIGLRLWEVATLAPRSLGLREAAMPFLEDLYEATHENVHLAVLDGTDTVYIERISGRSAVGVLSRPGARWPLHATGVGLVLLAFSSPELQETVCAAPLQGFTELTITDGARLRATLAEVRRTECAVSDRQITMDALSVAAPVRNDRGAVVAAVGLVVHTSIRPHTLAPAVRLAARGISRALGASSPLSPRESAVVRASAGCGD